MDALGIAVWYAHAIYESLGPLDHLDAVIDYSLETHPIKGNRALSFKDPLVCWVW